MLVAINARTGVKIYTADHHDLTNPYCGWYTHPDGNSHDCMFLFDNKVFWELEQSGIYKIRD